MKWLMRLCLYGLALLIAVNISFGILVANPGWAFAHTGGTDRLRIHATDPVPEAAISWASDVMARLDASAMPPGVDPIDVYVTGDNWRYDLFFAPVKRAGGVVYPFAPKTVFLSGADFEVDRLIVGGYVIPRPRTLTYYAMHEISHLTHLDQVGMVAYLRTPKWLREGMPDYIALGPAGAKVAKDVAQYVALDVAEYDDWLDVMMAHGAYPDHRLTLTQALGQSDLFSLLQSPPKTAPSE